MEDLSGRVAGPVAVRAVGRDEGAEHDEARAREQRRHLPHAADVLGAVFGAEAKVRVEAVAHVVAVEHIDLVTHAEQTPLGLDRQGGFAGARQAGEPKHAPVVTVAPAPVLGRNLMLDAAQVGGPDRDNVTLIGIPLHVDGTAADDLVALDEHEAPGAGERFRFVEREHCGAAQHDLGGIVPHHLVGLARGKVRRVDNALDLLHAQLGLAAVEPEPVFSPLTKRVAAQPIDQRPEDVALDGRVFAVARDFAALAEY